MLHQFVPSGDAHNEHSGYNNKKIPRKPSTKKTINLRQVHPLAL